MTVPRGTHPTRCGPSRRVVRELDSVSAPVPGYKHARRWRYELECGHVVSRRETGKTYCYCDVCGASRLPA
jgi:hypothetical protein